VFFVTKVNTAAPGTSGIAYSTYFGGGPVSGGTVVTGGGIAVDAPGNIYFSGTTNFYNSGLGQYGNSTQSADFPILNAYQPCLDTPILTNSQNAVTCVARPYAISDRCVRSQAESQQRADGKLSVTFLHLPWRQCE